VIDNAQQRVVVVDDAERRLLPGHLGNMPGRNPGAQLVGKREAVSIRPERAAPAVQGIR
jgi:hypothetical protein